MALLRRMSGTTHHTLGDMTDMKATLDDIRDHLADFEDVARPVRSYVYWEQHCFDIPVCWATRSVFDSIDGVDTFSDNMKKLLGDVNDIDTIMPQMAQQFPPMIAVSKAMQGSLLTMHSSFSGLVDQISRMTDTASAMGEAFDASKSGDYFYLPPEAFENPDFQRGLQLFLSPDGKAARFIVTHDADPATPAGISAVKPGLQCRAPSGPRNRAHRCQVLPRRDGGDIPRYPVGLSLRLADRGNRGADVDFRRHADHHPGFGGFTGDRRHGVAFAGRRVRALRAWCGQYIFGLDLNWIAPVFGLIILLAVGSDYNLLAGLTVPGGDTRGIEDRDRPLDGRKRAGSSPQRAWCSPSP